MMVMTIKCKYVVYRVLDIIQDDGDLGSMCTHSYKAQPLANSMNTTPSGLPPGSPQAPSGLHSGSLRAPSGRASLPGLSQGRRARDEAKQPIWRCC